MDWLTSGLSLSTPLTLAPGEATTLTLSYASEGLTAGEYVTDVVVGHDGPVSGSSTRVRVELVVTSAPQINSFSDLGLTARYGAASELVAEIPVENTGDSPLVVSAVVYLGSLSATLTWAEAAQDATDSSGSLTLDPDQSEV